MPSELMQYWTHNYKMKLCKFSKKIIFTTGNKRDTSIKCKQKNCYILLAYHLVSFQIYQISLSPLQVYNSNFDVSFEYDIYYKYSMNCRSEKISHVYTVSYMIGCWRHPQESCDRDLGTKAKLLLYFITTKYFLK